jgi:hypothetical protein
MASSKILSSLCVGFTVAWLSGCASQPASTAPAAKPAASEPAAVANEADTASAMERKFQDTARSYKTVQKDGKTMYCKREKVIGSTIPTMQCFTETQLRNQVEATEELKKRMRRGGGPCVQTGGCAGGG